MAARIARHSSGAHWWSGAICAGSFRPEWRALFRSLPKFPSALRLYHAAAILPEPIPPGMATLQAVLPFSLKLPVPDRLVLVGESGLFSPRRSGSLGRSLLTCLEEVS